MKLERALTRALRSEASRTQSELTPDEVIGRARRRRRAVLATYSATATAAVVTAVAVAVPWMSSVDRRSSDFAGPAPESRTTEQSRTSAPEPGPSSDRTNRPDRDTDQRDTPGSIALEGMSVTPTTEGSRVVFRFSGEHGDNRVPEYDAGYVDGYPREPGSGRTVEMPGQHFMRVSFTGTRAGDGLPEVLDSTAAPVAQVRYLGGFEQVQEVAVGVRGCHGKPVRPTVNIRPSGDTIVLDVPHPDCGQQNPGASSCGDVPFEEQTDSGAFGIRASGTSCQVARDVAAFADGRIGDPYGTPGGFSCRPEKDDSGAMTQWRYTCTRAGATVTFRAS